MHRTLVLLIMITLLADIIIAQQRYVVIDMETGVPVRNVIVRYGIGKQTCTIWDGSFVLDSVATDSTSNEVVLSRSGYMPRTCRWDELTDTIELLPSFNALGEVVVYGIRRNKISMSMDFSGMLRGRLPNPSGSSVKADISGAIDKLFSYKRRKKLEETKKKMAEY